MGREGTAGRPRDHATEERRGGSGDSAGSGTQPQPAMLAPAAGADVVGRTGERGRVNAVSCRKDSCQKQEDRSDKRPNSAGSWLSI